MKILGIETSTLVCGAAVVVDGKIVSEAQTSEKKVHAENIMRLIDASLCNSAMALKDIDAIAVSIGPGSFTGLRIGLSVAKGLVYATDKPLITVPTLDALARRAVDGGVVMTPYILSALDARRDEVYCKLFRVEGNQIAVEWQDRDLTLTKLFTELGDKSVSITGDAIPKIRTFDQYRRMSFVPKEFSACSAGTIAMMGETLARDGAFVDANTVEPKYVKEFHSTLTSQLDL